MRVTLNTLDTVIKEAFYYTHNTINKLKMGNPLT
jgi:hypothetical protein